MWVSPGRSLLTWLMVKSRYGHSCCTDRQSRSTVGDAYGCKTQERGRRLHLQRRLHLRLQLVVALKGALHHHPSRDHVSRSLQSGCCQAQCVTHADDAEAGMQGRPAHVHAFCCG